MARGRGSIASGMCGFLLWNHASQTTHKGHDDYDRYALKSLNAEDNPPQ